MGDKKDKTGEAILFTWKESMKIMERVVNHEHSDDLGGNIGRTLYATALDVANSGLLGPEGKLVGEIMEMIFGKVESEGEKLTEDLHKLEDMVQTVIELTKQVQHQLSVIESKIDHLAELVQWTYALGNTHPYATFLEEAYAHLERAKQYDKADGSLHPKQLELAQQFTAVMAGGLEHQLQLFYEGVIGKDITGTDEELGLLTLFLKQTWEKTPAADFKSWYYNACIFISKVRTLLTRGIHTMMWAVQATSPEDVDVYREKYSDWFQTIDNQLKQLIPVVMHQLFVNDTAYTFQIRPVGGRSNYGHITVTDSFVKDNHTLQRMVFPDGGIHADDTAVSMWMEPPVTDVIPKFNMGKLHEVSKRSRFKVVWDGAQFTFKIVKADIGKLSPSEPVMSMGTVPTTYSIRAYPRDYSFTQDDAVLTTGTGIILALVPMDWENRNVWRIINTTTKYYLATSDGHGTGGVFSLDISRLIPRFSTYIDDFNFSTSWVFDIVQ